MTPATGSPAEAARVARPLLADLGFDQEVRDLLLVDESVWVSHGDLLDVFSVQGAAQEPIALTGAGDLALDPAGGRVFAAGSGGITVYDAGTGTATDSWATRPCPRQPTGFTGLLFYSFGCGSDPAGIAALDPATGVELPTGIDDGYLTPPRLLAAGDLLVSLEASLDSHGPTTVRSYLREGDGSITPLASLVVDPVTDVALSPDGAELLLVPSTGSTVQRLQTADLVLSQATDTGGTPTAAAFGPAGSGYAVGVGLSALDQVLVYDQVTGALVSRSAERSAATGVANPSPLPGTAVYSSDGSRLYALVHPAGETVRLLTATSGPVSPSLLGLRLSGPRRFGDRLQIRVLVAGRPDCPVHLALVDAAGSHPREAVTDSGGGLTLATDADLNGWVSAAVPADLTHAAATVSRAFTVPAALQVEFTGNDGRRNGVLRYRSFRAVRGLVSGLPARRLRVTLVLQESTRQGWRASAPALVAATDSQGLLAISMGEGRRSVRYRLVVQFRGDRLNRATPQLVSPPWLID